MWCNFVGDAWKALFDLAGGLIRQYDQEVVASVSKFVDQLPSVMNQVPYESKLLIIQMCFYNMFIHKCISNLNIYAFHVIYRLQKVYLNLNQHRLRTVNSARSPTVYQRHYW